MSEGDYVAAWLVVWSAADFWSAVLFPVLGSAAALSVFWRLVSRPGGGT